MVKYSTPSFSLQDVLNEIAYDRETGLFTRLIGSGGQSKGPVNVKPDKDGYVTFSVCGQKVRGHRLAWFIVTGDWPTLEVDHDNRIRHDNRWANLRHATSQQNSTNTAVRDYKTSKLPLGVYNGNDGLYRVYLGWENRQIYAGSYQTLVDAVTARTHMERVLYEKFAAKRDVDDDTL